MFPATPAIAVDQLVKLYRATRAVDGISFALEPGSITGLLGGNGAGKTTTIAMILGLVQPTAGSVRVLGALMPRERYRVAIFGSARARPDTFVYDAVKRVAAAFAAMDCDIVTGGGPGLMQAANEGAASTGLPERSLGIRVELPFEQDVNPFVTQAFEHKTFFTRLHHFVLVSDAFVVTPGGIGTVLETLMVWQLLQVRHLRDTPLILAGHFWDGLLDWARAVMLRPDAPLVSPEDLTIPRVLPDGPSIVRAVREHHARWVQRHGRPA